MRRLSQIVTMKIFRDPEYFEELRWRSWIKSKAKIHVAAQDFPEFEGIWQATKNIEGWLERSQALLLYSLARSVQAGLDIVEIGSYKGRSTVVLASAIKGPGSTLHAIDPHTGDITQQEPGIAIDTWEEFKSNITACAVAGKVNVIRDTSRNAATCYTGRPIGMLFVDGWHDTEAVLTDWLSWKCKLAEDTIIVFDDWWQPPVSKAIMAIEKYLPPCTGYFDKELVYRRAC